MILPKIEELLMAVSWGLSNITNGVSFRVVSDGE